MSARRTRLSWRDWLDLASLGPRSRPLRSVLSALGIGIGIASLVAITGVADSHQAQLRADLIAMGANLLTVQPGEDGGGEVVDLPETAPGMIARIGPVQRTATVRQIPEATVYRSDLVPTTQSGGLTVALADDDLPAALDVGLAWGRWFDDHTRTLPTAVLGARAADRLGITPDTAAQARVWADGEWYAVIGILDPAGLAGSVDTTAFVADGWWRGVHTSTAGTGAAPAASTIYVAARPGTVDQVRTVLPATVNPAQPAGVRVTALSELAAAQESTDRAMTSLVLALGGICLVVGGVGIANTMVVAVLERRGEIGLRRALGARTGQVTGQFLLEAVLLALLGGVLGTVLGVAAVWGLTTWQGTVLELRPLMLVAGPGIAVIVGALAGIYPAARAAAAPPTVALRAV